MEGLTPRFSSPIPKNMAPPPARPRARAAWSRLPPVRKIGSVTFRLNRTSVGDEYGAGNPEVRVGSYRQITRTGGKRDFSPCVYRGLGEEVRNATQRNASTREKFVDPTLVDTKAGNGKVDSVLVAMSEKTEYTD